MAQRAEVTLTPRPPLSIPLSKFKRKCRPRRGGCFRHGWSDSRLESIREKMMDRCHNPNAVNYHRYGERGITVCKEWRENPKAFYDWALANGYADDKQLDRKKTHLGYGPGNCWWRTEVEQQNNRRNNRVRVVAGKPITASAFARHIGLAPREKGYKWNSEMKARIETYERSLAEAEGFEPSNALRR